MRKIFSVSATVSLIGEKRTNYTGYMNCICFEQGVEMTENAFHKAVSKERNKCSCAVTYST